MLKLITLLILLLAGTTGCGDKQYSEMDPTNSDTGVTPSSDTAGTSVYDSATGDAQVSTSGADSSTGSDTATTTTSDSETETLDTDSYIAQYDEILDIGHNTRPMFLAVREDRVLSSDANRWILWDTQTGLHIAEDYCADTAPICLQINRNSKYELKENRNQYDQNIYVVRNHQKSIFVVQKADTLEIRSFIDGSILGTIATENLGDIGEDDEGSDIWITTNNVGIARNGSYIWTATRDGLQIWSPTGAMQQSVPGDYSAASFLGLPDELHIANGAASSSQIEYLNITTGATRLSEPFSGNFHSWFVSGDRFITTLTGSGWIYNLDATLEKFLAVPTADFVGQGDYLISRNDILSIQNNSSYRFDRCSRYYSAVCGIFEDRIIIQGERAISIVNLEPDMYTETSIEIPSTSPAFNGTYGRVDFDGDNWVISNHTGQIFRWNVEDTTNGAKLLNYGKIYGIAGSSSGIAAIASINSILIANTDELRVQKVVHFPRSHMELSDDGTVLATTNSNGLTVLNIGNDETETTFFTETEQLTDWSLSADGKQLGLVEPRKNYYDTNIVDLASGSITYLGSSVTNYIDYNVYPAVQFSTDAEFILSTSGEGDWTTRIFQNGSLTNIIEGKAIGWINPSQFLVAIYGIKTTTDQYENYLYFGRTDTQIYNTTGQQVASVPELNSINDVVDPITSNTAYIPDKHFIWDFADGKKVNWRDKQPTGGMGVVAGANIIHLSADEYKVLVVPVPE